MAVIQRQSDSKRSPHNNILVTRIAALFAALLLVFTLTSCTDLSGMSKERSTAVKEAFDGLQASLSESFSTAETGQDMLDRIVTFADDNEIYYKVVNNNSIILVKQAADENAGFPDTTMHCSISLDAPEESAAKTAAVLTALGEASNVSRTAAVITLRDGLFYTGAMALPADYLDTGCLICIGDSEETVLFKNSASLDTHRFSHDVSGTAISGYKSYEISITDLPRSTPQEIDEEQTDPVLLLYEILSWCERSHIDYRLTSFTAGDSAETLPQSASMIISIDPSDIGKFQNKVYGMIEQFKEDHGFEANGPHFTLHHTEEVTAAIDPQDTTDLLAMIYTLTSNYEYMNTDEVDHTVGRQDISMIDVTDQIMTFTVSCRFVNASKEHDDSGTFQELARLNGFEVTDREIYPRWTADKDSLVYMTFERCADEARLSTEMESTCDILETGVFAMKNPGLPQIAVGISPDDCADLTKALILYIESEQASL